MCAEKCVGIDLAGSENRPTGFCVLDKKLNCRVKILHTDKEILEEVFSVNPDVIVIDAPLCLPKGRKSLEERNAVHLRKCDREILQMKIKIFPITLGPMRKLTKRGIKLKKILKKKFKVIETYPGAAQDILKIPRKQNGLIRLKRALERMGMKNLKNNLTGDELDAVTAALVGKMYLENNYSALGDAKEGLMIMPKI